MRTSKWEVATFLLFSIFVRILKKFLFTYFLNIPLFFSLGMCCLMLQILLFIWLHLHIQLRVMRDIGPIRSISYACLYCLNTFNIIRHCRNEKDLTILGFTKSLSFVWLFLISPWQVTHLSLSPSHSWGIFRF